MQSRHARTSSLPTIEQVCERTTLGRTSIYGRLCDSSLDVETPGLKSIGRCSLAHARPQVMGRHSTAYPRGTRTHRHSAQRTLRSTDVDAPDGRCPIVGIAVPGRPACAAFRPSCQSGACAVMTGDSASASPRTAIVGPNPSPSQCVTTCPPPRRRGAPRNCSTHDSSDTFYRERLGGTPRTSAGGRGLRSIGRSCAARNRALSTV